MSKTIASQSSALSMKAFQFTALHLEASPRAPQSESSAGPDKGKKKRFVREQGLVRGILDRLQFWCAMYKERRELLALAQDETFLSDLGLSKSDALQEAEKPFWLE